MKRVEIHVLWRVDALGIKKSNAGVYVCQDILPALGNG